jgi:hypothetical protein
MEEDGRLQRFHAIRVARATAQRKAYLQRGGNPRYKPYGIIPKDDIPKLLAESDSGARSKDLAARYGITPQSINAALQRERRRRAAKGNFPREE